MALSDLDEITRLLELMSEHDLEELEVEREGARVRIKRRPAGAIARASSDEAARGSASAEVDPSVVGEDDAAVHVRVVKAPIVGTVFRAPDPGAVPFVELGSRVRTGQVLCLIEAMKLMNEIEAETGGVVVKRFVSNAQPVDYGAALFAIKPNA